MSKVPLSVNLSRLGLCMGRFGFEWIDEMWFGCGMYTFCIGLGMSVRPFLKLCFCTSDSSVFLATITKASSLPWTFAMGWGLIYVHSCT